MNTPRNVKDAKASSLLTSNGVVILIALLRWLTTIVSVIIALSDTTVNQDAAFYVAIVILVLNGVIRTLYPIPLKGSIQERIVNVSFDVFTLLAAIAFTGYWESPFLIISIPTLIVIGLSTGGVSALISCGVITGFLSMSEIVFNAEPLSLESTLQNTLVFLTSALIGSVMRLFAREAEARSQLVVDEMHRMARANSLLLALHDVAQTLPASLDLGEVIASTRNRFHDLYDVQYMTILVADSTHNIWRTELAEGVRIEQSLSVHELPAPLAQTLGTQKAITYSFDKDEYVGCSPHAKSGMYIALRARGSIVGIAALESSETNKYSQRDSTLLQEVSEPLALAIDNALWFQRLRNMGAEEERSRIARDLHDRLAQSLAYVAFELERLMGEGEKKEELSELRDIVREVVGELRETLYELRATVDQDRAFFSLAQEYLPRFGVRTGIDVEFSTNMDSRVLPLQIERELWRIMQEALNNTYKHAEANHAWVKWMLEGEKVTLTIKDDGKGFSGSKAKNESFGLIGMRERADTIHAQLSISSTPGKGTIVKAEVEVPT